MRPHDDWHVPAPQSALTWQMLRQRATAPVESFTHSSLAGHWASDVQTVFVELLQLLWQQTAFGHGLTEMWSWYWPKCPPNEE